MMILYSLFTFLFGLISLFAPFILAYILGRSKRVFIKNLLLLGALLCEIFLFWWFSYSKNFIEALGKFLIYITACFFLFYILILAFFVQISKKFYIKIFSIIVISIIFGFVWNSYALNLLLNALGRIVIYTTACFFITFILMQIPQKLFNKILVTIVAVLFLSLFGIINFEREEWPALLGDNGLYYIFKLEGKIREYVKDRGYYPYKDAQGFEIFSNKPCEWTQNKYTISDSSHFMIVWDKKPHGFIFKWRYAIFVGKEGMPETKIVFEREFQKLLKKQQKIENTKEVHK